jgi:hypothetical protein
MGVTNTLTLSCLGLHGVGFDGTRVGGGGGGRSTSNVVDLRVRVRTNVCMVLSGWVLVFVDGVVGGVGCDGLPPGAGPRMKL